MAKTIVKEIIIILLLCLAIILILGVLLYEYIPNDTLNYLRFPKMTEEWLDFVTNSRRGISHTYDIVEGPMADDTIYNYIQNYMDGKITRAAFWELVKFKYPTHQISFHTISALDTLRFIGSEVVYGEKK